jgi:hypothetical protein
VIARDTSEQELWRIVKADIREGVEKYYGMRQVPRPGLDLTGQQIRIDELVLNYDMSQVAARVRERIRKMGKPTRAWT